MKKDIMVSINCLSYNHIHYISDAIESFLSQKTTFNFEILIHDDASTDGTQKIIEEYEKKYPQIVKPIYQKTNQQKLGVKKIDYKYNFLRSDGKYIALCEGDDFWTSPYKLQKQFDYMENNNDCSLCCHATYIIKENKKCIGKKQISRQNCKFNLEDLFLRQKLNFSTSSIFYRKRFFSELPYFYYDCPVGDFPIKLFLLTNGYGYYMNDLMSVYRENVNGSWTSRIAKKPKKYAEHNLSMIKFLSDFDRYTNYRYSESIKAEVKKRKNKIINIQMLHKEIDLLKINRREERKKLKIGKRIKLYFQCYFSFIFNLLKKIKLLINNPICLKKIEPSK